MSRVKGQKQQRKTAAERKTILKDPQCQSSGATTDRPEVLKRKSDPATTPGS